MRVVFARFPAAERAHTFRAAAYITFGVFVALGALLWIVIGLVAVLDPQHPDDVVVGVPVFFGGGLFPVGLSVFLFAKGAQSIRRMRVFRDLAQLVRGREDITVDAIAQGLGYDAVAADRLVFDACVVGILEETKTPPAAQEQPRPPEREPKALSPSRQMRRSMPEDLLGCELNGTYRVERLLGAGGMGAVYMARHARTGRRCAVKTLLPENELEADAISRFKREASAASALGHSGIVAIHDFDITPEGMHFMVSELLDGQTLEERIGQRGALPWAEASAILTYIGSALAAAHSAGILHRDLKPGNVFLSAQEGDVERVVLLDFGLAKSMDASAATKITTTGTVVGTPLYMSPEQARGQPLDERTDVYSLTAVLYEMVAGSPPFVEDNIAALYARLLKDEPPRPSTLAPHPLPPEVDGLVERGLAKDRDERFGSVTALLRAVAEVQRKNPSQSGVSVAHPAIQSKVSKIM